MYALRMTGASHTLLIHCRLALGLSQQEFAALVGVTKRTLMRWEERGTVLLPPQATALARALNGVRPDLAVQVAASVGATLPKLGVVPAADSSPTTISDPVDSVVRAAASVMGCAPNDIRGAVAAAFAQAREIGLDVEDVVEKLVDRE
jgi:transcriptional regulator with XRE-family HTH domain